MKTNSLRRTLAERVKVARGMRTAGKSTAAIAAALEVAPVTARRYLKAPPCSTCGEPVIHGGELCSICSKQKWTPEAVVAALRAYEKEFGKHPTERALSSVTDGYPGATTVARYFGTFRSGLQAAGFEPPERRWTPEEIVEAMRKFKRETKWWPRPSDWAVAGEGWPIGRTVRQRFGSWQAALDLAAKPMREAGEEVNVRPRRRTWTRERIVEALRTYADEFGRAPTRKDLSPPPDGYPWAGTLQHNFGTFKDGLRAAGLELPEKQSTPERIIEAMLNCKRATGRWPRSSDWTTASDDSPTARTVRNRFGSWQAALDAAMARLDAEVSQR